jgi:hypothetical protein
MENKGIGLNRSAVEAKASAWALPPGFLSIPVLPWRSLASSQFTGGLLTHP